MGDGTEAVSLAEMLPWRIDGAACEKCGRGLAWCQGVGRLVVRHANGETRCGLPTAATVADRDKALAQDSYAELTDAFRALLRATDAPGAVTVDDRANDCSHGSASGVDQSDGPDKIWACDHCGLRWRQDGSPLADLLNRAVVERLLEQLALDRGRPYWVDRVGQLDGVESWLESLRDWLP